MLCDFVSFPEKVYYKIESDTMPLFSKRRQAIFNNGQRNPNAREVRISVVFTRLGEIDTINERFSCEATLFVTWRESINIIKKSDDPNEEEIYYCDVKSLWDPQLYIGKFLGRLFSEYLAKSVKN